jgi:hypothetical protein
LYFKLTRQSKSVAVWCGRLSLSHPANSQEFRLGNGVTGVIAVEINDEPMARSPSPPYPDQCRLNIVSSGNQEE